jgi:hypothetical protein
MRWWRRGCGRRSRANWASISGGRDGVRMASWCTGTRRITIGCRGEAEWCVALRIEHTMGGRSGHSKAELSTRLDTGGKCRRTDPATRREAQSSSVEFSFQLD